MNCQEILAELPKLRDEELLLVKARVDALVMGTPKSSSVGAGHREERRERARRVQTGDDVFLEAPAGAPLMTPDYVKRLLADWP